ncbi:MAG: BON domain-containing protein [Gemmatimonadaceae bacterium]
MTLLAGAGMGAALMYFLDPGDGARRRHLATDRGTSMLRTSQRETGKAMRNARNHAQGMFAKTRNRFRGDGASGEQLLARVRAELGRQVERVSDIDVVVDGHTVTLHGRLPSPDATRVVEAIQRVRGVERVDSRLTSEAVSDVM